MDDCINFSTSKDDIYAVYVYLKIKIKIEDDWELDKYFDIELDHLPNEKINLYNMFISQSIISFTPSMDK